MMSAKKRSEARTLRELDAAISELLAIRDYLAGFLQSKLFRAHALKDLERVCRYLGDAQDELERRERLSVKPKGGGLLP